MKLLKSLKSNYLIIKYSNVVTIHRNPFIVRVAAIKGPRLNPRKLRVPVQ